MRNLPPVVLLDVLLDVLLMSTLEAPGLALLLSRAKASPGSVRERRRLGRPTAVQLRRTWCPWLGPEPVSLPVQSVGFS